VRIVAIDDEQSRHLVLFWVPEIIFRFLNDTITSDLEVELRKLKALASLYLWDLSGNSE